MIGILRDRSDLPGVTGSGQYFEVGCFEECCWSIYGWGSTEDEAWEMAARRGLSPAPAWQQRTLFPEAS